MAVYDTNVQKLNRLKSEVLLLEKKALDTKKQYDTSSHGVKFILARELLLIHESIKSVNDKVVIICSNIKKIQFLLNKIDEVSISKIENVDTDSVDEIAVNLEDVVKDVENFNVASDDLRNIKLSTESVKEFTNISNKSIDLPETYGKLDTETESWLKDLTENGNTEIITKENIEEKINELT
ncbi:MAG: hypothetical protein PHW14_05045 [Candidatus Omnitrophica bacterium]|nr:hypothetical protein [Candidatus Omnitrophota bacterium]